MREAFLAAIGPVDFNKLVASVDATRKKGRLRYWQEQLLSAATARGCPPIDTAEEFVRVFSIFAPEAVAKPPVTKEAFLDAIRQNPFDRLLASDDIPPDWMAAAWAIDAAREAYQYEMARTVSKVGELAYYDDYLALLAAALTVEQQVELFIYIRDHGHREPEFRGGFEAAFPASVASLPPPLPRDPELDAWVERQREAALGSRGPLPPFLDDDIPF